MLFYMVMIDFSSCLEGSLSVPLCDPSSEEISPKAWLLLSQSCPEALLPPWFWGHFFFGRTDHWIFGGTLAVFLFGTIKGCSLLIECEAILADLFLREGKYQWSCGPTKVMKSHVVRTLDWVDLRDYPTKKPCGITIQILGDTWNEVTKTVSHRPSIFRPNPYIIRSPFYMIYISNMINK